MFCPVNGRVGGSEPGESKDNIFSTTAHDVEEVFLGNPFNVGIEGRDIPDDTGLVCCLVYVVNCNEGDKFFSGESMFSDKLPVNAGDVCTRVY